MLSEDNFVLFTCLVLCEEEEVLKKKKEESNETERIILYKSFRLKQSQSYFWNASQAKVMRYIRP